MLVLLLIFFCRHKRGFGRYENGSNGKETQDDDEETTFELKI